MWMEVEIGQRVNMAATDGLMSARLNAGPGPQIDRDGLEGTLPA